jgi:ribosomal-protein-alanine N-acetyltransferase
MSEASPSLEFKIVAMTYEFAEEIATWQYPDPYKIYSLSSHVIPILMNPSTDYYAVVNRDEILVGYCCFGAEARVIGGDYSEAQDSVLDIGIGMRPQSTGQGLGKLFVRAILDYAQKRYRPGRFRVTIAEFNKRSLRTFQSLGFCETFRFLRSGDGLEFIQLERTSALES